LEQFWKKKDEIYKINGVNYLRFFNGVVENNLEYFFDEAIRGGNLYETRF